MAGAYRHKPAVSLCTGMKDRLPHLQKTVLENLENNRDYPYFELVLLNNNCPNPDTENWVRRELSEHIASGRVSYYHYSDTDTYKFAHAKNLAYRLAKGDILCNVDADNFTGPGFAAYIAAHLQDGHSFVTGPRDGRGLAGRMAIRREHYELSGGYDERIVDWEGDDFEFTSRLERLGLKRRTIHRERFLRSIRHDDSLRTRYSAIKDKWASAEANTQYRLNIQSSATINPNGTTGGRGRVRRNFGDWVCV